MAKIDLNPDGTINDVLPDDASGLAITADQLKTIAQSKYGHAQFKYIDGELVEQQDVIDALDLDAEKINAINYMAKKKTQELAEQQLGSEIAAIRAANNVNAIKAITGR